MTSAAAMSSAVIADNSALDRLRNLGGAFPDISAPPVLSAELDDKTIAYATAMREPFEGLRRAAAQLAGILVLVAAGNRAETTDHPMLVLACQAHDEAMDTIRSAATPRQGQHHNLHLTRAASWIGQALARARSGRRRDGMLDVDETLLLLRRGWQELQWAAGALPGFEIVALEHACCSDHARRGLIGADASATRTNK